MLALSVRQPYAELILRGIKTAELRSRSTTIIGRRFFLYASKGKSAVPAAAGRWPVTRADNIVVPREPLPAWMIELAEQVKMIEPGALLPTGVIVGSAVIERVTAPDPADPGAPFRWHLAGVERAETFIRPARHPQPVWFKPF